MLIKSTITIGCLVLLITGIALSTFNFSMAQNGSQVEGVLWGNTTWTATNSPYTLTGIVQVAANATLTIEPGVMVNLNDHQLRVNGTLTARGSADQITINGLQGYSQIWFTDSSSDWDENAQSGSIIEKTVLNSAVIYITGDASPKINGNLFINSNGWVNAFVMIDGDSRVILSNNTLIHSDQAIFFHSGNPSPTIIYNNIYESNFNVFDATSANVTAVNNWWGTTDIPTIKQTIYDYTDDPNMGNVSYLPFLNLPSPYAPTYVIAQSELTGSISPNGTVLVGYGSNITFALTPNSGYHVSDLLVNGTSVGALTSYTTRNVTGVTTVLATFAVDPTPTPTPTATSSGSSSSGSSSSSDSSSSSHSTTSTPTATPTAPEFTTFVIAAVIIAATLTLLYCKKKCNPASISSFSFFS